MLRIDPALMSGGTPQEASAQDPTGLEAAKAIPSGVFPFGIRTYVVKKLGVDCVVLSWK